MRIDDNLKLVIPIRTETVETVHEDGKKEDVERTVIHAYHTPISREVFEVNYRALSETKARIFGKGTAYAASSGPMIASLTFREIAKDIAMERGEKDPDTSLLMEIRRLTTVLAPTASGYELLPVDIAISREIVDPDEWRETESFLVFFTSLFSMTRKAHRKEIGESLAGILRGSITSFPPMEYLDSLRTSTTEKATPETRSSVPS